MATSPLAQVPSSAVDIAGISACTATPTSADPRAGTAYDLIDIAAAAPIWFHPVPDGRFVMAAARRWYDAAPVGGNPGSFSSYSEDLEPSWALLDGPSGRRSPISGFPINIPTHGDLSRTLVGAASQAPDHLYLLHAVTDGALLQRFHVSSDGSMSIGVEETLPTITLGEENVVVFDKGVYRDESWLYVHGTDAASQVYRIRKPAAHLGVNRPALTARIYSGIVGTPVGWEYYTGTGYSLDVTEADPVRSATGVLSTAGPMSFGSYRTGMLMTTVEEDGGVRTGRVWRSVRGRPFQIGEAIELGDEDSYLGGGIQLQPLLVAVSETGAVTTIPYVVWTKSENGSTRLVITWGLLSVAR